MTPPKKDESDWPAFSKSEKKWAIWRLGKPAQLSHGKRRPPDRILNYRLALSSVVTRTLIAFSVTNSRAKPVFVDLNATKSIFFQPHVFLFFSQQNWKRDRSHDARRSKKKWTAWKIKTIILAIMRIFRRSENEYRKWLWILCWVYSF